MKNENNIEISAPSSSQSVKEKWQGAVNETSGFVAVPVSLLKLQLKLGLSAVDMIVLINLLSHWWDSHQVVYPRNSIIASRTGMSERTVQRSIRKLMRAGLVDRLITEKGYRAYSFNLLANRLARMVNMSLVDNETNENGMLN